MNAFQLKDYEATGKIAEAVSEVSEEVLKD